AVRRVSQPRRAPRSWSTTWASMRCSSSRRTRCTTSTPATGCRAPTHPGLPLPGDFLFPCLESSRRGILPLMGASPSVKPDDTEHLLAKAAAGDQEAWGTLLARHRDRLRAMIALRLDPRLQGRLDPSDVLQEAFLTASLQLKDYAGERAIPFFL